MARTRLLHDAELAQQPDSPLREHLREKGWSVGRERAHHPVWGHAGLSSALVLQIHLEHALSVLSIAGLVHRGGEARC